MKNTFILLLGAMFILTSCHNHLRYFTKPLMDEHRWTDRELRSIQFYLSEDVVLYRKLSDEESRITKGKIRIIDGSDVKEIIIEKGTPGLLVHSPAKDKFAVSFDRSKKQFLMFGLNKKSNGRYVLLAKEWNRNYGKVTYGDEIYDTAASSAYAALMVDLKKANKVNYKSRKAKGRRIR